MLSNKSSTISIKDIIKEAVSKYPTLKTKFIDDNHSSEKLLSTIPNILKHDSTSLTLMYDALNSSRKVHPLNRNSIDYSGIKRDSDAVELESHENYLLKSELGVDVDGTPSASSVGNQAFKLKSPENKKPQT